MGRDRGRESGLESVWCRRSQGKVRTGDAMTEDRRRNGRGPETEMWYWWPVVLQVRESTVSGPGNGSGPETGKWSGERMVSRVPGKSADRGRKPRGPGTETPRTWDGSVADRGRKGRGRASPRRGGRRGRRPWRGRRRRRHRSRPGGGGSPRSPPACGRGRARRRRGAPAPGTGRRAGTSPG